MQASNFIKLRICALICAVLLSVQACKKPDHWHIPPGCAKPAACNVEKMLVTLENDSEYNGPRYPAPYKFYKTYGPDGRVNFIDAFIGPMWTSLYYTGTVQYSGNQVYIMHYAFPDTLFSVKLNQCGQPVSAISRYNPGFVQQFTYSYDRKGRLSKVVWSSGYTDHYEYDQYDNIVRIHNGVSGEGAFYISYTYNYSRPAKGIYLEQDFLHFYATELLEMLGLLNLQSHHLRTSMTNTYEYPTGTFLYFDHVVQNGYVQSYRRGEPGGAGMRVKSEHTWNCGNTGGNSQKY
ncbi:RHS repeat protein [Chitinophaga agrisoli]|uniref:RHS repeat protein n=1 Tax=Chitinophaga agrisoli TaxID=2607653 RepID=A0A5B2VZI5_9BACT|nr:RHS repeat protein [Chitinophaga agrisoli]KAA2244455.1 RHS repeat protein [Chitinophaga agrisoli]